MKELLLKIAGVKTEEAFYKKYPTQEAFFKAHPEAKQIIAQFQKEQEKNTTENPQEQMMGGEEESIEEMAMGGMIKRKDGSYSKRGLWDNIRANKGSGKKPTKQMLEQAKKIQAEEMMYGGMVDSYLNGGGINNPGFKALPKEVQDNIIANMAMGGYVDHYFGGGPLNTKDFEARRRASIKFANNNISNSSKDFYNNYWNNYNYLNNSSNNPFIGMQKKVNLPEVVVTGKRLDKNKYGFNPNDYKGETIKEIEDKLNDYERAGAVSSSYLKDARKYYNLSTQKNSSGSDPKIRNTNRNANEIDNKKAYQTFLNLLGGTDYENSFLKSDGIIGKRTKYVADKLGISYDDFKTMKDADKKSLLERTKINPIEVQKINEKSAFPINVIENSYNPNINNSKIPVTEEIVDMAMGGYIDEYADGGGIPQRYKNMGFTRVGQKKQGDGKHKWKVLAKKGDQYKVVQGGWRGMQDFKQHKSEKRRDRFWDRMGGRDSAKANDPFSPLYWHKRFGTWADGGILPEVEQLILAGQDTYEMGGMVEYPTKYFLGGLLDGNGPRVFPMGDQQEFKFMKSTYPEGGMIGGPMMGNEDDMFEYAMGGGINIDPSHKGMFTAWAKKHGMSVQEAANHVMANKDKYDAHTVKMANFAKNAAGWKKAMGGRIYEEGGMLNSMTQGIPVQTETFQGQPEQVALPDGTIKSVDAKTSHENMSDNTVTDFLPGGSHIQSARNKLSPDQYAQLMQMFKPETADQDIKKLAQVYQNKYGKKNGKKLSPADISEYAKNKYQTKSTPNSFDTDKLKEGNKKAYLDLSMQMNDLIKSGKELAEGAMAQEQMMAWGGMIPKYNGGTGKEGVQKPKERKIVSLKEKEKELSDFYDVLNFNPSGVVDYPFQKTVDASKNLFGIDYNTFNERMKQYENIIPGLASKYFKKDDKGNYLPPSKENTIGFQQDFDKYVDNMVSKLGGKYTPEQINTLKSNLKFNDAIDPSAKRYDSKMGQFTSSRSGFQFPLFSKETTDRLNKEGISFLSQAVGKGLLSPEEEQVAREEMNKYQDYKLLPLAEQAAAVTTTETPAQKAEKQQLEQINRINPAARIPMQNRFNYGLLEGQLGRGLGANEAMLNAGLAQSPLYIMETPDTYIRSRKNEIPVGNILYNIEKAQRNAANALAAETGDWSTLAGNIANAGANAYNQIGDTLSALNEKNVNLYNETQGLQQDLLANNMGVRNQNLTNMQNMLNFKRNLFGQKAVKDAELYSEYAKNMGESSQKEQNQKLEMLNIMAAKPDMFKGEQGQMFVNQILGNTNSFNNSFAGSLLDGIMGYNRYNR